MSDLSYPLSFNLDPEYLGDLAAGEDDWRRAFDESLDSMGEVRDHFSRKIQSALSTLVAQLAEAADDALEGDGEEIEYTDRDLDALHSAAVLLAFRVIFLSELERRGFLYADATEGGHHKLDEYLSTLQADNADRARWRDGDFLRRILELSEAIVDGDESVRIEGGSIFQDLPDDETFDDRIGEVFEALREWSESNDSRAFDEALAETGNLLVGRVNRGEEDDGETPSYFGAGGTEHSYRVLGDIYEQMLGLISDTTDEGTPELRRPSDDDDEDSEQTKLAAYYTPRDLVFEVVRPTLGHLFEQTWHEVGEDPAAYRRELEELTIVDPAMGSGHFLTAAALELAREIAWVDSFGTHRPFDWHEPTDNPNPIGSPPEDFEPSYIQETDPTFDPPDDEAHTPGVDEETFRRQVGRELPGVVRRSIYGVDKNPLACELGKLSLWLLSAIESDKTGDEQPDFEEYLDDNIKSGDSLVGMFLESENTPARLDHYTTVWDMIEKATRSSSGNFQSATGDLMTWKEESFEDRRRKIRALRETLSLADEDLPSLDDSNVLEGHSGAILAEYSDKTADEVTPYDVRRAIQDACTDLLEEIDWLHDLAVAIEYIGYSTNPGEESLNQFHEILTGELPSDEMEDEEAKKAIESKLDTLVNAPFSENARAVRERLSDWVDNELVARSDARPFHWELEFPEIFIPREEDEASGGFDAVLANPPFTGSQHQLRRLPDEIIDYKRRYFTKGKSPDYSGFFFHRYNEIANFYSVVGSLATNSIAQSSNWSYVTKPLFNPSNKSDASFEVRRATPNRLWPGDESLHFSSVVIQRKAKHYVDQFRSNSRVYIRGKTNKGNEILPEQTEFISSYLDEYPDFDLYNLLSENPIVQQGFNLRGNFSIHRQNDNQSLSKAIKKVPPSQRDALTAYLNARAVQQNPEPKPADVVIDFAKVLYEEDRLNESSEDQKKWLKKNYGHLFKYLQEPSPHEPESTPVQKHRKNLSDRGEYEKYKRFWWLFGPPNIGLRRAWEDVNDMVAFPVVVKVWSPLHIPKRIKLGEVGEFQICPMKKFFIAPGFGDTHLAITSSIFFETIVRRRCGTMGTGLNFSPTDVLPYFPWPWSPEVDEETGELTIGKPLEETERELSEAIDALIDLRRDILENPSDHGLTRDQIGGPTDLYNVYDSDPDGEDPEPNADSDAIWKLRRCHVHLLRAVLRAYARNAEEAGWDDPTDDWGDLPDKWDHLADGWRDVHERATEAHWTFDRPWLDRTLRYVPEESIRRDLFALIDATNSKRYEQELDILAEHVLPAVTRTEDTTAGHYETFERNAEVALDRDTFDTVVEYLFDRGRLQTTDGATEMPSGRSNWRGRAT